MIQVLPPDEARKIAAGEVIDRPAALVREFVDNALDSKAGLIEVAVEGGGIAKTEVADDGEGMSREDLELCWITHATSKITSLDDLKTAGTLGFRGEALAAAAAVSRLEVLSGRDGKEAWKLTVGPGEKNPPRMEQSRRTRGTTVRALGLFDAIPARKRFLRQEGSEARLCRTIFNDKALAFPGVEFRFVQDGKLKALVSPASSFKERFVQILYGGGGNTAGAFPETAGHGGEEKFIHEIAASGPGFSAVIIVGGPELYRSDRRLQFVFANGRRIQDYSILQALEYGVQGWFPNGTHPLGAVFLSVDPCLADFNIHPAKREARFADSGAIHHAVSTSLRNFCRSAARAVGFGLNEAKIFPEVKEDSALGNALAFEALELAEKPLSYNTVEESVYEEEPARASGIRYIGRVFGLFIIVEKDGRLYIIDQHAAHERILYDRFLRGPIARQELLVAIPFTTESPGDDAFLRKRGEELEKLGIVIREEEGVWRIEALPADWRLGDRETVKEILGLVNAGDNMAEKWAAGLSCRRAVKDGDYLDMTTALNLAEEALNLPVRRCPHGRPICFELTREELLKAVRRT